MRLKGSCLIQLTSEDLKTENEWATDRVFLVNLAFQNGNRREMS